MIRNIVFDMGNVVICFDPPHFLDRAGIHDPEDRKILMNELFLSVEWAQMDSGILTEKTAEPLVLNRIPERLHGAARELLWRWSEPGEQIPGMEDLIRRLKAAGYRIYLLSNASVMQHEYWPRFTASRYFDGKLISCDVRTVKPCHEIYRIFTERFSLNPDECLFTDDSPANVAAAEACGWVGIVFHGSVDELERKMCEKGLQF